MKKHRLKYLVLSALLLLAVFLPDAARALDDDEFGGYAADTLSIQVGYPGGPYYEKAVFTLSDLESMDVVYADYTFIDNMPSVIIAHVKGVRLADIVDAAGIDIGSVRTFLFWIGDKQDSYYTAFSKSELIDTPRYCYYSLPDNFDYDLGEGNEYATSDAQRVDAVMALADDWTRAIAGATFGSDYMNLNTNTRFRLVFGQTNSVTRTASRSAKWVYSIVTELSGEPSIALDASELNLVVGNSHRVVAAVEAADPVIAENTPVAWSSDNERVATVDDDGNITARAEGTAVITAEFLSVTASVTVNASVPDEEAPPVTGTAGSGGSAGKSEKPGTGAPATPSDNPPDEVVANAPAPVKPDEPVTDTPPEITPDDLPEPDEPDISPEITQPQPEDPPDGDETREEASVLPVIGVTAICLFAGGALFTLLRARIKRRE